MCSHHLDTKLAQTGNRSESTTGAVTPPLHLSTAYRHPGIGQSTGYDYIRTGNPTRDLLEQSIATLESGLDGFAFSSGMAAIQTVFSIFTPGDEFVVTQDVYGGSYRLFENHFQKFGLGFTYVNSTEPEDFEQVVTEKTKGLFIETPTNPLMTQIDIEAIAKLAKKYNLLLIVDNTFFTPYLQQPLQLGADIVIHSATKYLGGHNDVLAGLVVANDEAICESLAAEQNASGAVLSPFDCWLLMRGIKTLGLRMKQHETNAKRIAEFLKNDSNVTDVLYPGHGGMLSFRVQQEEFVPYLLQSFELISFAESLGGVETFITYPATQTHADIPEEVRSSYGVDNRLLRLSVGIEDDRDLTKDLQQALDKAQTEVKQHV
ncbi:methionine biosynthesis PLP-dependent protein [Pontibacillus yanchengensis]|uniref:Methionine biosynthesis PLP-dependent protein n=2 Tax=Pontibacillus yanchengensis TaxID=462910 RepID=A0ACC7VEF6_9BACI|nr:methionine biosynthesis PLP-dependent protein [Pontibacillus yanchengensis]MYL35089.1 methionine biosynthesis PLP-dependent protein [Pontibacillus yanchengensis]MYL52544.1 methionine biosynthesis PLP-dependent protein [Pontibacillus yanchengensis]